MPVRTRNPISDCSCQGGSLKCGGASTYRAGCGCSPCRDAHNSRIKANTERRKASQHEPRGASSTTGVVTPITVTLPSRKTRLRRAALVASVETWRPRNWPPLDRPALPSGPDWREENLGPWCLTHHDWAFRDGADHDQSISACKFKSITP